LPRRVALHIAAPPDRIFPYLIQPELLESYVIGLVRCEPLTGGEIGLGSRSKDTLRLQGQEIVAHSEIVEFERHRRLCEEADVEVSKNGKVMRRFRSRSCFELLPERGGTVVAVENSVTHPWSLRLFTILFPPAVNMATPLVNLERLKEMLES
jgi:uncharacterized protein YndB with AHSA1/START domain